MKNRLSFEHKKVECEKYKILILAVFEYEPIMARKDLIPKINEHVEKGRLTILKYWFKCFIEGIIENQDVKFTSFLKEKTGYDLDVFKKFNNKIERVIKRNKINTDEEYRDILIYLDNLIQSLNTNKERILHIDTLIAAYDIKIKEI